VKANLRKDKTMSFYSHLRRLVRNQEGGAIVVSSLLIMFVLMGMFALSIDHNRNFMYKSDMQGKVRGYSFHLALEYRQFKIREAMERVAQSKGDTELTVSFEPGLQILPERPDIGGNGGILSDAMARDRLSKEALRLIRQDGHLGNVGAVIVEQECGPAGADGRPMLLNFHAIKPQSDMFAKNKVSAASCTSKNQPGCVTVTQVIDLGFSCDASNKPDPSPGPTLAAGPGTCGPDNSGPGDFSRDDGVLSYGSAQGGAAPPGGSGGPWSRPGLKAGRDVKTTINDVVFSLDIRSMKYGATSLTKTAEALDALAKELNTEQSIWGGLTIGNVPTYGAGVTTKDKNSNNMGSGGLYDNSQTPLDMSGESKELTTRLYKFEAGFWAQHVRTCKEDPVWTYKSEPTGKFCWQVTKASAPIQAGWVAPNNCSTFGAAHIPGGLRGWVDVANEVCSSPDMDTNADGTMDTCSNAAKETIWDCVIKSPQEARKGQWFASCPKNARDQNDVYKSPDQFLETELWYSRTLRKDSGGTSQNVSTYKLGPVKGEISVADLAVAPGSDKLADVEPELKELAKKNTDRAWPWACRSPKLPSGSPVDQIGHYGLPFGEIGGEPLVQAGTQANIGAAINNSYDPSLCPLPAPPAKSARQYSIQYVLDGCSDPDKLNNDTKCDLPEGFYRAELKSKDLKPKRAPVEPRMVPNDVNSDWEADGGPWVFKGKPSASPAELDPDQYKVECPRMGNTNNGAAVQPDPTPGGAGMVYADVQARYGAAPAFGKNAARWVEDGNEEEIVLPEIPAEQVNIASVVMERRNEGLKPFTCTFDSGEGDFRNSEKEKFVFNIENTGKTADQMCDPGQYPWFCNKTWAGIERETNFWYLPGKSGGSAGVIALNGDMGNVTMPLGVETANAARYGAYKAPAMNNGSSDAGITTSRAQNIWNQGKTYNTGLRQLVQVLAMPVVRMKNSDYAPPNLPVVPDGLRAAFAVVKGGYGQYNIHEGQGANQCSLLKASLKKIYGNNTGTPDTASPEIATNSKMAIFVGQCPELDDTKIGGVQMKWNGHGNKKGELGSDPNTLLGTDSAYRLKEAKFPTAPMASIAECVVQQMSNAGKPENNTRVWYYTPDPLPSGPGSSDCAKIYQKALGAAKTYEAAATAKSKEAVSAAAAVTAAIGTGNMGAASIALSNAIGAAIAAAQAAENVIATGVGEKKIAEEAAANAMAALSSAINQYFAALNAQIIASLTAATNVTEYTAAVQEASDNIALASDGLEDVIAALPAATVNAAINNANNDLQTAQTDAAAALAAVQVAPDLTAAAAAGADLVTAANDATAASTSVDTEAAAVATAATTAAVSAGAKSDESIKQLYRGVCENPYCELNDPSLNIGDCVSRMYMCMMSDPIQG
jgi:hypothetical protein